MPNNSFTGRAPKRTRKRQHRWRGLRCNGCWTKR